MATSSDEKSAVETKSSVDAEEGEICDEKDAKPNEDSSSFCHACNLKLDDKMAFVTHINSVHLGKNPQAPQYHFLPRSRAPRPPPPVPAPLANPSNIRPTRPGLFAEVPQRLGKPWINPRFQMGHPRPEMGHQRPEMGHPRPEMGYPRPEMGYPRPEMIHPRPEMGHPRPEMGYPRPEMVHPRPEMGHPRPEMGYPRHEMVHPRPEMGHPRPEMGYPRPEIGYSRMPGISPRMRQPFTQHSPLRTPVPLMSFQTDSSQMDSGLAVGQSLKFERPPTQHPGMSASGNFSGVRQPLISPPGGRDMPVMPNFSNSPPEMVRPGVVQPPRGVEAPQKPIRPLTQSPIDTSQGPPDHPSSPPTVPLLEGHWSIDRKRLLQNESFTCEVCQEVFKNSIAHVIHIAGLRHKKAVFEDEQRKSQMVPTKSPLTPDSQINPPVSGALPISVKPTVPMTTSTAILESPQPPPRPKRQLAKFELSLYKQKDAILGFDYVTEFQHNTKLPTTKQSEFVCDLCDLTFLTPEGITQHVTSTNHILLYLEYHDAELYRRLEEEKISKNKIDRELLKEVASKAEERLKCRYRMRVKVQTDENSADGPWKEVEDELVRPVVDLPGHRLSLGYSTATASNHMDDLCASAGQTESIDVLLKSLTTLDTLAAGRPPSWVKPIDRLELLKALASHKIKNDTDADVCLQFANSLTVALLQYRLKQIPTMDAIDTTKLSDKLTELCKTADSVSEKIQLIDSNIQPATSSPTPNSG